MEIIDPNINPVPESEPSIPVTEPMLNPKKKKLFPYLLIILLLVVAGGATFLIQNHINQKNTSDLENQVSKSNKQVQNNRVTASPLMTPSSIPPISTVPVTLAMINSATYQVINVGVVTYSVTVVDGKANYDCGFTNQCDLSVSKTLIADFNGDGIDDGVISTRTNIGGGNSYSSFNFVMLGLKSGSPTPKAVELNSSAPTYSSYGTVIDSMNFENNQLKIVTAYWGPNDSHANPTQSVTDYYTWNGSTFVKVVIPPTSMLNWKTYTNSELGFSVKYPNDWLVETKTGGSMPVLSLTSPATASSKSLEAPDHDIEFSYFAKISDESMSASNNYVPTTLDSLANDAVARTKIGNTTLGGETAVDMISGGMSAYYTIFALHNTHLYELFFNTAESKNSLTDIEKQIIGSFQFTN